MNTILKGIIIFIAFIMLTFSFITFHALKECDKYHTYMLSYELRNARIEYVCSSQLGVTVNCDLFTGCYESTYYNHLFDYEYKEVLK